MMLIYNLDSSRVLECSSKLAYGITLTLSKIGQLFHSAFNLKVGMTFDLQVSPDLLCPNSNTSKWDESNNEIREAFTSVDTN